MITRARRTLPVLMLTACLLAGCSTGAVETVTADSACRSFKPLSMSKDDTEPTRRQIVGHNRAYDAVCPPPKGGSVPQRVARNG